VKVVFHADDFGFTPGINAGIVEAYERGVLRSTSLMVPAAACAEAVALARATPRLDVGVHLTLVEGMRPILPPAEIPSLVRDGAFLPTYGSVGLRYVVRRWRPEEARRELAAQLERMAATGLVPSHLDSHEHLHLLPGVFPWVAAEARRRGIRFVRTTVADPLFGGGIRGTALIALRGVSWFAARRTGASDLRNLRTFVTVGFQQTGGKLTTARLLALLDRLPRRDPGSIVEVMVHPGHADEETRRIDRHSRYRRENDLALLCDPALPEALARRGIEVTSFRDLTASLAKEEGS
jgi:predicted glycoside hydrolase/deacetylase ChbG (UPF0249 family)